jgi:hypothetical protein
MNMKTITCTVLIASLVACSSSTVIYTNAPGADVYIGKKLKGQTPYEHKDYLLTGMSRKIRLEKEGYATYEGKIRKLETINGGAVLGAVFTILPILWVGGYDNIYQIEMNALDGQKLTPNQLTFSDHFSAGEKDLPAYVGMQDGLNYVYQDGNLHVLDKSYSWRETIELDDESDGLALDGYIDGDNKQVVKYNSSDNSIYLLTIGANNSVRKTSLGTVLDASDGYLNDGKYGYNRSSKTNNFICYSANELTLYSSSAKKLDSYRSNKQIIEAYVLPDNRIISLEWQDNAIYLCERENGTENYQQINSTDGRYYKLDVNVDIDRCFVSSINGITDKKDEFSAKGCELLTYSIAEFKELDAQRISLQDDMSPDRRKYLVNRGVVSNKQNAILNLEEHWLIATTTTSSSGSSRTSTKLATGNIVAINFGKAEVPQEMIVKMDQSGYHPAKLSFNVQLKDNQLLYTFNTQIKEMSILNQVTCNSDLVQLAQCVYETYENERTHFHPITPYYTPDGHQLYFHQYKKDLGVAVSSF